MFSTLRLAIPKNIYTKWQSIIDDLTKDLMVPVGLIMRAGPTRTNVFVASKTPNNPYKIGDSDKMENAHCNVVLSSNQPLHIQNALKSDKWKNNSSTKLGMISYLGFPILWPNNKKFGTICIFDKKERAFTKDEKDLMENVKNSIEKDLEEILSNRNLKQ